MNQDSKESNFNNREFKPEFSRQFRLGLVLYGGVSLAIYMNGVCQEIFNAVQGKGIYKLIKAVTDSDIIVDIISGTSAGGINGVFLSHALANCDEQKSVDFKHFADIWRKSGDIDELLRKTENLTGKETNSILDGEGYYQEQLEEIMRLKFVGRDDKWYSDFRELDLFVTGTDFYGEIETTLDNLGNTVEIKNHPTVFHLKSRKDRLSYVDNPFQYDDNTTRKALAKLCRITSCFPVAFPIVEVNVDNKKEKEVDGKLIEWLQTNKPLFTKNSKPIFFVDGGVLDNRPFSYTISEIASRPAYQPVDRKLFYIDPNPEHFEETNEKKSSKPNALKVALDCLSTLPSYESIANDLGRIKELNQKVKLYSFLRESIIRDFQANNSSNYRNKDVNKNYINLRLLRFSINFCSQIINSKDYQTVQQKDKKIKDISKKLLSGKLKNIECLDKIDINFAYRKYCFLIYAISELINNNKIEKKQKEILYSLQYYFTWQLELIKVIQESLKEIILSIYIKGIVPSDLNEYQDLYDLLIVFYLTLLRVKVPYQTKEYSDNLNEYFKLLKKKAKEINEVEFDKKGVSKQIFEHIYNSPICVILNINKKDKKNNYLKEVKGEIYNILKDDKQLDEIKKSYQNKEEEQLTILQNIDKKSNEVINEILPKNNYEEDNQFITDILDNFKQIDAILYPYEALAELQSRHPIEVVRISPEDNINLGLTKDISNKLTGTQLRAFGAFFKKCWRSNDIFWGRLDGLNYLIETLVTKDSIKKFECFINKNCSKYGRKQQEFISRLVDNVFKNDQQIKHEIKSILNELYEISKKAPEENQEIEQEELELIDKFKQNLALVGHTEILNEDCEQIILDEMEDLDNWKEKLESQWLYTKDNISSISNYLETYQSELLKSFKNRQQTHNLLENSSEHEKIDTFIIKKFISENSISQEKIISNIPPYISDRRLENTALIIVDMLISSFPNQFLLKAIQRRVIIGISGITMSKANSKFMTSILIVVCFFGFVAWLRRDNFTSLEVMLIIIITLVLTISIIVLWGLPCVFLPLLKKIILNLMSEEEKK